MINIPFLTILLFSTVNCFRVPRYDNPDLVIDEEQNLIEPPKLNLWQVLLRPKSKSTFKNVFKLFNNPDSREKYSIVNSKPAAALSSEPLLLPTIKTSSDIGKITADGDQFIVQEDENSGIVSKEVTDSQSEEQPKRVIVESISQSESNEKSDSSDSSSGKSLEKGQSKDSSKQSSSEQSSEVKTSNQANNARSERIRQLEALRYEADLPKSLHNFEMDKPRFQHSIRDGWTY